MEDEDDVDMEDDEAIVDFFIGEDQIVTADFPETPLMNINLLGISDLIWSGRGRRGSSVV